MKVLFLILLQISAFSALSAKSAVKIPEAQRPATVFEEGQDGYKVFRIPAIIRAANGDLLAFCEARQGGDASDDHGKTWSERREITTAVKKPVWGWYATGPVHSIQIQRGPHRGRLVVPSDHRIGDDGADHGVNGAHAVLSDDHGVTWRLGAIDATYEDGLNANETTVVELNDGTLYFNTRDQNGDAPGTRGETWSRDGGEIFDSRSPDWKNFRPVEGALDLPVVQGALLRVDDDLLLFSGPDNNGPTGEGRSDMRLRYSTDEAETWQDGPLLHTGPAAYSDMVLLPGNRIGVLFEAGDPNQKNASQRIVFQSLHRKTITHSN